MKLVYLIKQSVLKTLEGTFLGFLSFVVFATLAFLVAGEFPSISVFESNLKMLYWGVSISALLIGFTLSAGVALALWLYWQNGKSQFSRKDILTAGVMTSFIAWIIFFVAAVAPVADLFWRDFFVRHDMLTAIFDLVFFATSLGCGFWTGWRLSNLLQNQKNAAPDRFGFAWKNDISSSYVKSTLYGVLIGLFNAIGAMLLLAISIELHKLFIGVNFELIGFINSIWLSLKIIGIFIVPVFLCASLGGWGIAHLFFVENLNHALNRQNAFWLAASVAGLVAFFICIMIGVIIFSTPRLLGGTVYFAPYILGITFLAWLLGGRSGLQLFKWMSA
jgi:hypothetical protein